MKRGLTDFERKLKAAAASGALGYAIVQILPVFGVHLAPQVAELIPLGIAILGGYTVHSAAVTTTFSNLAGEVSSVRTGPSGTPIGEPRPLTGAIPIPRPAPEPTPDPLPEVPDIAPAYQASQPDVSFTEVVTDGDNATKVITPGAAFWQARAEARPGFDAPDGN